MVPEIVNGPNIPNNINDVYVVNKTNNNNMVPLLGVDGNIEYDLGPNNTNMGNYVTEEPQIINNTNNLLNKLNPMNLPNGL